MIDRKSAGILHKIFWSLIIFGFCYLLGHILAILLIILVLFVLSSLLKSFYEYLKKKGFHKLSLIVLILGITVLSCMLSFIIYNYPKINDFIIDKATIISEKFPVSKKGFIKEMTDGFTPNIEPEIGTGGIKLNIK